MPARHVTHAPVLRSLAPDTGPPTAAPEGSTLHQRETLRPRWPLRPLAAWFDAGLRPRLLARLAEIRALLGSP